MDHSTLPALHYNISDLDEGLGKHQRHSYQVPKSKYTNLFLDGEHYGVGGTNSWGAWPLEKYRALRQQDLQLHHQTNEINIWNSVRILIPDNKQERI